MNDYDNELSKQLYQLGLELKPYIISLLFYPNPNSGPSEYIDGGTAGFLDTGKRKILITADHVIKGFENERKNRPESILVLAGGDDNTKPQIISDWSVIERNKERDIATIEIPDNFSASEIGKTYIKPKSWPPERVKEGEVALLAGYPGILRKASQRGLELRIATAKLPITSVSERRFLLADSMDEREIFDYIGSLPKLSSLGGMSGSPVFVSRDSSYELVGVLYQGRGGAKGPIFVAHIEIINDDGTINFAKIP